MVAEHYRIERGAMERALALLAELPYRVSHKVIADLQANSSGPHVGPVNEPPFGGSPPSEGSHDHETAVGEQ